MLRCHWKGVLLVTFAYCFYGVAEADAKKDSSHESPESSEGEEILQTIAGRVQIDGQPSTEWISRTKVVVDGGKFYGFLKLNGEFEIHNISPGSYLVEVVSPNHVFDPARVDISSKSGKVRARKVNLLKTSSVAYLPYPLKFKTENQATFFEKREKWNVLDTLKNPMIWLLIGPMLIMLVLPRLMKNMDPDSQKEMNESMNALQQQGQTMPSLEEMFTNWFGGGSSSAASKAVVKKPKPTAKKPRGRT